MKKKVISKPPGRLPARWATRLQHALRGSRDAAGVLALIDQVIVGGTSFVTILLLGRLAGPHALGIFALVMTIFFLLATVQDAFIALPYTIFGSRLTGARHRQYSAAVVCHCLVWSAVAVTFLALVAGYFYVFRSEPDMARAIGAFALIAPVWLFREFARRQLFAHMQLTKVLVISAAGATVQLTVVFVLGYFHHLSAATALFAIGVGSSVAGVIWLLFNHQSLTFTTDRWRYYVTKNWVIGRWLLASQGTAVVAANTMPWLVWIWLGSAATGLFAACDAILRFANPMIVSLSNVLTPQAAIGLNRGGKPELNRIVWKTTAQLTLFLFAFCIALAFTSEWLLNRSFGETYAGYSATLIVLGINQLVARFSLPARWALMLLERASVTLLADGAGVVVSLLAAPLLLPAYGSLGAALALLISSVASSAAVVAVYVLEVRDRNVQSMLPIGVAAPTATSGGSVAE